MKRYLFANCEINLQRHELLVDGKQVSLEPLVFDLLTLFVKNPGHLISRQMLINGVWSGKAISDSAIDVAINAARTAVGDNGKTQRIIKTIPRRGFRLLPPVDCTPLSPADITQPTLAVLDFDLAKKHPDKHYIARGIADDIATELSRFRDLSVLSTQSTFQFSLVNGEGIEFASNLGATHVVSGQIQIRGNKFALNVTLTEVFSHRTLWSEKFRFSSEDTFTIQDRIVDEIASRVTSRLEDHLRRRVRQTPTSCLSAYDCVIRGLMVFKSSEVSQQDNRLALEWFDKALEIDPNYSRARAWRCCAASNFWSNPPRKKEVEESFRSMKLALETDPTDHEVHHIMGALQLIKGNEPLCDYHLSKSIELNPNDSRILIRTGYYRSFLNDDAALNIAQTAFRRNPLHPDWYWHDVGVIHFGRGNYKLALECLDRGYVDITQNRIYRLACLVRLSKADEVKRLTKILIKSQPTISLSWTQSAYPYRCYLNQGTLDNLLESLAQAGVPYR